MTVSSTQSYVKYNGDGSTVAFTIPFYFILNSDISIQVSDTVGNVTSLTNGSDFTVTGAGDAGGGVATLNKAYASGYQILIQRDPPETQETKYYENGKFPAKSHEKALDKLTMLIQNFGWQFNALSLSRPNFFSNYYDAKSRLISNLADPQKDQDAATRKWSINEITKAVIASSVDMGSLADTSSDALGDALIGVRQPLSGAKPRTQHDKNRESISILDFGAVGDGVTDDTAAVQAAINATGLNGELLVPSISTGEATRYRVTSLQNPNGVKFVGEGSIFFYDTNGGANQINLKGDLINLHIGQEYLFRPYNRMRNRGVMEIHLFGDSTVAGNNGESPDFRTEIVIGDAFKSNGFSMGSINNWGVGGSNVTQMDTISHLSTTSDLFVIKYGINDAGLGNGAESARLIAFETALRSKISEIRSHQYGSMPKLGIILMMPNSTNDVLLFGRNSYWYEQLRNIYVRAARDYSCAMFDTYNAMPISSGLAGNAMDNPFGNGIAIHPLDAAMPWVYAKMVDIFFSRTVISKFSQNKFIHEPAVTGIPSNTAFLTGYNYGISAYRAIGIDSTGTWPVDGTVFTHRSPDEAGLQILYPFSQRGRMLIRVWIPQSNSWSTWSGQEFSLTAQNSWTTTNGFSSPNYKVDASGKVTIHAYVQNGAVATGTTLLSGLPSYLYPADEGYFVVVNSDGTTGVIGINGLGNIFILNNVKSSGVKINVSFWPKGM